MDSTRMVQSTGGGAAVRAALSPSTESRQPSTPVRVHVPKPQTPPKAPAFDQKPAGYGLPCAKCKTYYLASLNSCPICKTVERVSPIALIPARERVVTSENTRKADGVQETLLRDLKTKLAADSQGATQAPVRCKFAGEEPTHKLASVCKTCYEDLEERLDLYEAALHMDLSEAAQVIYDAVWADTSDSNKTYLNAARALLAEVRKRAGLNVVLGSLQPLSH
jgi:hypothetical protein